MLSQKVISDFIDATYDKPERKTESSHAGVMKGSLVQFDGASIFTPCINTAEASDGDRVTISIRNNTAYITGILRRASDGSELRTSNDGTGVNSEET